MGLLPIERRDFQKAFPHSSEWCDRGLWESSGLHGSVGHGRKGFVRGIEQLFDCSVCDLDLK